LEKFWVQFFAKIFKAFSKVSVQLFSSGQVQKIWWQMQNHVAIFLNFLAKIRISEFFFSG